MIFNNYQNIILFHLRDLIKTKSDKHWMSKLLDDVFTKRFVCRNAYRILLSIGILKQTEMKSIATEIQYSELKIFSHWSDWSVLFKKNRMFQLKYTRIKKLNWIQQSYNSFHANKLLFDINRLVHTIIKTLILVQINFVEKNTVHSFNRKCVQRLSVLTSTVISDMLSFSMTNLNK